MELGARCNTLIFLGARCKMSIYLRIGKKFPFFYSLLNLVEKKKNFYDEDVTATEAAADFFMLDDEEVDFAMSATPSMDTAAPFSLP